MNPETNLVTRRTVLRGAALLPFAGIAGSALAHQGAGAGPFSVPALAYPFAALEPHIDAETMQIHHDRHHQTYVTNLNNAVGSLLLSPEILKNMDLEATLRDLDKVPEKVRTAVRNNGGGHFNHSLFWKLMKPGGGGPPTGPLADAINGTFGSYEKFQAAFEDAGLKRFGSGWVWLAVTRNRKLEVVSTPNQDSPVMDGGIPILGNDVWEHAYYLKYRNKRADYLKAWWNVVDWETANAQFKLAK